MTLMGMRLWKAMLFAWRFRGQMTTCGGAKWPCKKIVRYLYRERYGSPPFDDLQKEEMGMSEIQRYGFGDIDAEESSADIYPQSNGMYVHYADHRAKVAALDAENDRLRESVLDAEHLCKWLLQSDLSDLDKERVIRERGITFALIAARAQQP